MLRPLSSALAASDPPFDWPDRHPRPGLDFAASDHLALAAHPSVRSASPVPTTLPLETRLAAFLQLPVAATFASGICAIRQTLAAVLSPGDDVIVDSAAHPAMAAAVLDARARLHRSPAASFDAVERRLARLARQPRPGRLVIAVPAVSPQASRSADLAELSLLARHHDALLIVDVTQDLGTMGQTGGGVMEIQSCLSRADVVLGSFSNAFATPGGFAAFRNPVQRATFGDGPGPGAENTARIGAALDLITSTEGHRRRRRLHDAALRLRNHLMSDGIKVMGQPSPFVVVPLPPLTALPRTALLQSAGPRVSLLQAPDVPLHAPRWRIHLSAAHGPADIDDLADLIRDVSRAFDRPSARQPVPA